MAQQQSVSIQFPPGRLIMGNLYKGSDKDDKGQPRVVKSGPNKGQPFTQYFIGVAIPKQGEQHWAQTPWGQQILAVGAQAWPNFYQNPAMSWKVEDGDSTVPNKRNKRPCDMEGAKGHWIVKFSSGFAPRTFTQPTPGTFVEEKTEGLIKNGYWVQVYGNVSGNGSTESPGVYVGHSMVLFVRADAEITSGPDAATAFAGAAVSQALPGASGATFAAPAAPGAALPGLPVPGGAPAMPAAPAAVLPAAPVAVAPNPAFLNVPGAAPAASVPVAAAVPPAPGVPPAPAAAPAAPVMTAAGLATGVTYQAFRGAGWTDEQMRAAGYIA